MAKYTGVTQGKDGSWSYRIKKKVNGQVVDTRIKKDENGLPFLTARAAYEAKLKHEAKLANGEIEVAPKAPKATVQYVYDTYMESSEAKQKAPATLTKQRSMWKNHVQPKFGDKDINEIKITDLDDFLFNMYQTHSYAYTEGFLKFFYLLFGYAYKLELIDGDKYYRMFGDSKTRLTMPVKEQADVEDDLEGATVYSDDELALIESCFKSEDGNLLTAFIWAFTAVSESLNALHSDGKTSTGKRAQSPSTGRCTMSVVKLPWQRLRP